MEKPLFTPTESLEDARFQITHAGDVITQKGRSNLIRYGAMSVLVVVLGLMLVATRVMPSGLIPIMAILTGVPVQLAIVSYGVLKRGRLMSDLSIVSGYSDDQVIDYVNLYARGAGSPPYKTRGTYDLARETEAVLAIIESRIVHHTKVRNALLIATVLLAVVIFCSMSSFNWASIGSPSFSLMLLILLIPCTPIFTLIVASSAQKILKELRKQRSAIERGDYTAQQLFVTEQRYALDGKIVFVVGATH